jgi:hypothetical protein
MQLGLGVSVKKPRDASARHVLHVVIAYPVPEHHHEARRARPKPRCHPATLFPTLRVKKPSTAVRPCLVVAWYPVPCRSTTIRLRYLLIGTLCGLCKAALCSMRTVTLPSVKLGGLEIFLKSLALASLSPGQFPELEEDQSPQVAKTSFLLIFSLKSLIL